jgi:hypothetical protein
MRISQLPRLLAALPAALVAFAALALPSTAIAQKHKELGRMWTFENAPLDWFEEAYGFRPSESWLEHVRLSSLRFGNGCSASFVSSNGLILTNHHCARDGIATLSESEGVDWLQQGFVASELSAELRVPGLAVRQLVSMTDVTDKMNEGLDGVPEAEQRKKLEENEQAILAAARTSEPDLEPQVVELYQGGQYQLYQYRVFDDVRLVTAPHLDIQKFGGDPDNFTYPRFSLDFALLRAWENDAPADTAAYHLRYKSEGPKEGETVFVTGNPGSTGRLNTVAQMEYLRDEQYPRTIERIESMYDALQGKTEPDQVSRRLNLENALKAYRGYLDGLRNERVMQIKRDAEQQIREAIASSPELEQQFGDVFEKLEQIVAAKMEIHEKAREPGAEIGNLQQRFAELNEQEGTIAKRVGEAYFAVYGTEISPDATFTLRISDGIVRGFPYNGTIAPWFTSLYGLYARYTEFGGEEPFDLPDVWIDKRDELDLSTPVNFVATCDIIGGNSGSPMVNTDGDLVGLIFDGNIEMLGNRFVFTDDVARTVCVHPAFIIEALRKIYDAGHVADELVAKKQPL